MANGHGGEVTYTVKELIGMLEATLTGQMGTIITRLDDLDVKLDTKASELSVSNLQARVEENSKRIAILELQAAGKEAVSKWQRWFFGAVGFGILTLIAELIRITTGH